MALQVYIDGACEPINPGGTGSYGLVVRQDGNVLFSEGAVVGSGRAMSNNVAEYSGLIAFLKWYALTARLGDEPPVIYSDSKLVVNQMTGTWRVKGGLYVPYYTKARNMLRLPHLRVRFQWIPREQNGEADELSKKALMDAGVRMKIQAASNHEKGA